MNIENNVVEVAENQFVNMKNVLYFNIGKADIDYQITFTFTNMKQTSYIVNSNDLKLFRLRIR